MKRWLFLPIFVTLGLSALASAQKGKPVARLEIGAPLGPTSILQALTGALPAETERSLELLQGDLLALWIHEDALASSRELNYEKSALISRTELTLSRQIAIARAKKTEATDAERALAELAKVELRMDAAMRSALAQLDDPVAPSGFLKKALAARADLERERDSLLQKLPPGMDPDFRLTALRP